MVCEPADPRTATRLVITFTRLPKLQRGASRGCAGSHTIAYEGDEKRYSALTCSKCRAEIVMAAMWDARTATRLETNFSTN